MDIRAALTAAVSPQYQLGEELGGGGMSRVYRANDAALDRPVVIKVLAPELAGDVNAARFRREIQALARLHHPHIVAVLSAGEADGLPYYVMPFVQGESLRARLLREGELPIPEVTRLAREIAEALAHAHAQGIVHRDIKPENVLLESGHALVADFGIAKAVADAADARLTSTGTAIGTPQYMAPEQAVGTGVVDHRADLYALGVLMYEMLTGFAPFGGMSPSAAMAAKMTTTPTPVEVARPPAAGALAGLVAALLSISPADRPQRADEVVARLDGLVTPAGGTQPALTGARTASGTAARAAGIGVAIGDVSTAAGRSGRRALIATLVALAVLGGAAFGWMRWRDRAAPGSLVASGALAEGTSVLVADVRSTVGDSVMARALTEALRIDLSGTSGARIVSAAELENALRRMSLPVNTAISDSVAREIVRRDGHGALVTVEVTPVGSGFSMVAHVRSPDGARELGAVRAQATGKDDLLGALNTLSKQLRGVLGESMRSVQAAAPLDQVTTRSFEALQLYSQARADLFLGTNGGRGERLLREAIALDSTFAMAQRRLGIHLSNRGELTEALGALDAAVRHSRTLPEYERQVTLGSYYAAIGDTPRALQAYAAAASADPTSWLPLSNATVASRDAGDHATGLAMNFRADSLNSALPGYGPAITLLNLGRGEEALRYVAERAKVTTASSRAKLLLRYRVLMALGRADEAAALARDSIRAPGTAGSTAFQPDPFLSAEQDALRGRTRSLRQNLARWQSRRQTAAAEGRSEVGRTLLAVEPAINEAFVALDWLGDTSRAKAVLDSARVFERLRGIPVDDRGLSPVMLAVAVGRLEDARTDLAAFEAKRNPKLIARTDPELRAAKGLLALRSGKPKEALSLLPVSGVGRNKIALLRERGEAFLAAGMPDSARATWERYIETPAYSHTFDDQMHLPPILLAVAEQHFLAGDTTRAVRRFEQFIALRKDADPELQPQVAHARARVAQMRGSADAPVRRQVPLRRP